jgi:hypothetical protein
MSIDPLDYLQKIFEADEEPEAEPKEDPAPDPEKVKEEHPLKAYIIHTIRGRIASTPGSSYGHNSNFIFCRRCLLDVLTLDLYPALKLKEGDWEDLLPEIAEDPESVTSQIFDKSDQGDKMMTFRLWVGEPTAALSEGGKGVMLGFDPLFNADSINKHVKNGRNVMEDTSGRISKLLSRRDYIGGISNLYDYFKLNPLMLYVLDDRPELKAKVIETTGIKDLSQLGRGLKKGMI